MSAILQQKIDEHLAWIRQRSQICGPSKIAAARSTQAANQPRVQSSPALPPGLFCAAEVSEKNSYTPPDEIVEGLLAAGASSMIYGASNSGKTFFALDIACAVSRGEAWLGRQTKKGLVVYIAAESVGSIKARLHAYQRHHECRLNNMIVVQHAVNLTQADQTDALISAIKQAQEYTGIKCELIIGDTLARMSAGADENSAEDMSLLVAGIDRIRRETLAHFCIIHHSGKDAERGARGHSSLRAAVDTEIEVSTVLSNERKIIGRQARVTKQRDLNIDDEINFDLRVVQIGITKWGRPTTSCVLVAEKMRPVVFAQENPENQQRGRSTEALDIEQNEWVQEDDDF